MTALRHSLAALALLFGLPIAAVALLVRPAWRRGFSARLGGVSQSAPGCVWLHSASVGETRAALALIPLLQDMGRSIVATATSPDGLAIWRSELPDSLCSLAPIDHPWLVERALSRMRPSLVLLVETEIWPSLISATRRRQIPVAVVSGRLSDRSFSRYRFFRFCLGKSFRSLSRVVARSDRDLERFVELGVSPERILVGGDLKAGGSVAVPALAADLARALSSTRYVVAGSTHFGEERAALSALDACERAGCGAALVLAPRHLERADEVEKEARECGRVVRRRSALGEDPIGGGEILLLDTLGELAAAYAGAASAFVGGTLVPVGGHNLLEPLRVGCPVCFGPHIDEVRENARFALESGAGVRVETARDLARVWMEALTDSDLGRRAQTARDRLESGSPVLARIRSLVLELTTPVGN